MTLCAVIKKATILKKIITVLTNLFHKVSISINDSKLNILMITTCNSMLFDVSLVLDEVQCDESLDGTCTFSVNSKHFLESFNTLRSNDSVKITISSDQMIIETISKNKIERAFLFATRAQNLSVGAEPGYDHEIEASHLNFPKLCKALSNASNELVIGGNSKRITIKASLEGMYTREVEIGDGEEGEVEFEDTYLTEHFLDIAKIANIGDRFVLKAKKDSPICVEARKGDICNFKVFIKSKNFEPESP